MKQTTQNFLEGESPTFLKKIQKIDYLKNEKSFLNKIKTIFHTF